MARLEASPVLRKGPDGDRGGWAGPPSPELSPSSPAEGREHDDRPTSPHPAPQISEREALEDLISKLMRPSDVESGPRISEAELRTVLRGAADVLLQDRVVLSLQSPITVVGSLMGNLNSTSLILDRNGLPPHTRYLFLGNFVDHGEQGMEVFALLLALKQLYPDQIFLLRGKHECGVINRIYGFYDQCQDARGGGITLPQVKGGLVLDYGKR